MTTEYRDIHGRKMKLGDKIRLIDIPPPNRQGKPRPLVGYLYERRGGGFSMMCYDEIYNELFENHVWWRPAEAGIPHPRCEIIRRQKPSYVFLFRDRRLVGRGKLHPVQALEYELGGVKPIFNFIFKLFVLTR